MYLVIEGVDGSGKSTLVKRLAEHLNAHVLREPGTGEYGEALRALLLNSKISDRTRMYGMLSCRSACMEQVEALLAQGRTVISDRGALSTYVYQCSSLENENAFFDTYRSLMPSNILYIVLDIDYETYKKRRPQFDDALEAAKCRDAEAFDDLRQRYNYVGRRFAGRLVDARCSEDEVFEKVLELL